MIAQNASSKDSGFYWIIQTMQNRLHQRQDYACVNNPAVKTVSGWKKERKQSNTQPHKGRALSLHQQLQIFNGTHQSTCTVASVWIRDKRQNEFLG